MSEFNNVTVIKKANVYFNGNVISRTVKFADGTTKTLGFMLAGEYVFNVGVPEIMEIQSGELDVLLPNEDWKPVKGGESFNVPENSQFTMRVHTLTDYICSFV
ncbi:MAG: pyrimidine/purine nucleoside phosphorylase [Methylococcaceae bacterium]|nr:pyrimidine/purine nucleoside phosphorylase [Methylococcaceae bacterium]